MGSEEVTKSIKLPVTIDIALRNIKDAKIFAMDIGGSLTKIAYYSTLPLKKVVYDSKDSNEVDECTEDAVYELTEGARLHFIKFETKHIEATLNYIQSCLVGTQPQILDNTVKVTGGGAYKYASLIETKLGLKISKEDEMECMIRGCNFLLRNITDESFVYQRKDTPAYCFQNPKDMYPYLLVTIGSGVSVLKVDSEEKFERIGGTATGGGTFWGLGKLLTSAKDFDELLSLAEIGDHRNVDMLVKDIYGSDYTSLGLPGDLIASSFGKAIQIGAKEKKFSEADIARSLLYIISNDIGQIACLYALLHKVKRIYFGGFFLRHRPVSLHTISYAINYWGKGQVQANFLRHEGYLGAIGAFLKGAEALDTKSYSWTENLYGSSSFQADGQRDSKDSSLEIDHLEIDRFDSRLRYCSLLRDPEKYIPDTVDLTRDHDARKYWLQCFEDSLPKFTDRAIESQTHSADAKDRAEGFKEKFLNRLQLLKKKPFSFGNLTVRSLLDMREHILMEYDFHDCYLRQKQLENKSALALLPERLKDLAAMSWEDRQESLALGFLAGNVFDWGAKEVALLMEGGKLDFKEAMKHIGPRPWLIDDVDHWIQRLRGPSYKCVCVFIDNSGADVILGVLPFVEDMLRRGSSVILCANSKPILNDVTYAELVLLLQQVGEISPVVKKGLETGKLVARDSGQGSPCLDLSRLNNQLNEDMVKFGVDLLVLEGMGRAIHTNLDAAFKCDSLKVAVLKNKWLAQRLGGDMFSVVFKYETVEN